LPPREGFIQQNFSPASKLNCGIERMYYTEANAGRIDSIRATIHEWEGVLTRGERALLLSDLMRAANSVSNIAGTYGCYLKHWKKRALQQLNLARSATISSSSTHQVFCTDANRLAREISSSIVYADPPYTKRQYSAYYHLPETIAVGDEPTIKGSTGLRPWEEKSSNYCYRKKAPDALEDLVSSINCEHFFLSYNEDGQVPHDTVVDILSRYGRVQVFEAQSRRYKSSGRPHKGSTVLERLYYLAF
jgi:adenine-specific DNA-methyltransferase